MEAEYFDQVEAPQPLFSTAPNADITQVQKTASVYSC